MGTLCDEDIMDLAAKGKLFAEGFAEGSLTPNGYDLRVSEIRYDNRDSTEATIMPGHHFLVSTLEFLDLPPTIIGQIWIRSSFARKGIIGSFGAVDAGFRGNLTLSFFNAGSEPLSISREQRIAQIVFHTLEKASEKSYSERSGSFQGSRGITVKGRT